VFSPLQKRNESISVIKYNSNNNLLTPKKYEYQSSTTKPIANNNGTNDSTIISRGKKVSDSKDFVAISNYRKLSLRQVKLSNISNPIINIYSPKSKNEKINLNNSLSNSMYKKSEEAHIVYSVTLT